MERPLISVIVPVYGTERYLPRCLDSLLAQSYRELEILLVDDGSPDCCGEICDACARRDARVRALHRENGGQAAARNAGLDACRGEYVAFADSDDFVSPCFIEALWTGVERYGSDIAILGGYVPFWRDGDAGVRLDAGAESCAIRPIEVLEALRLLLYQRIPNGMPFGLFRREIFAELRLPEGWVYEDLACLPRAFMAARRMAMVEGRLYAYRIRPDSTVHQRYTSKKLSCIQVGERIVGDALACDSSLYPAACSRAFACAYSVFAQTPLREREARELLWRCMLRYRGAAARDRSALMRPKNRIGARCSYLGRGSSYLLGRLNRAASAWALWRRCRNPGQ